MKNNLQGLLIVNAFWHSASMAEMEALLSRAAERLNIRLEKRTNAQMHCVLHPLSMMKEEGMPDFVLFWDKDIRLALQLEQLGMKVFNSALSIALCDDKTLTHLCLEKAGLPMPRTILCPATFPGLGYPDMAFLTAAEQILSYPMVIKEGCGSFGQQVYLARNRGEAERILGEKAGAPLLMQQFIQECAGRDIRLYMAGGKCIAAMERRNNQDFRANIQNGGSALPYTPMEEEIALAAQACSALGLSFAGVDILHGKQGPLICEVNSNAHFTALAALTHQDIAGAILAHVQEAVCGAG